MTTPRLVHSCDQHAGDPPRAEVRDLQPPRTGAPVQPPTQSSASATEHADRFDAHAREALLETCGMTGLAEALGVSTTLVRDWVSPDSPKHFPAWALIRAREVAPDFVTALEARLATTAASTTVSIESLHRRITSINGTCANELDRALADGVVDENERRSLSRLLGQLARTALAAQARVEDATA